MNAYQIKECCRCEKKYFEQNILLWSQRINCHKMNWASKIMKPEVLCIINLMPCSAYSDIMQLREDYI